MSNLAFKNDYGKDYRATVYDDGDAVDISSATTKEFVIRRPDGSVVRKAGTFVNSGTDGQLKWTVTTGFHNLTGTYSVMVHIVTASREFHCGPFDYEVAEIYA